jgi:hypothetical protein
MIFRAPHPVTVYDLYVPHPELNDVRKLTHEVFKKRTCSNALITYVSKHQLQMFTWQFSFSIAKMWEIYYFIREYGEKQMQVIDHKNRIIVGYLVTSVHDFTHERMNDYPNGALMQHYVGGDQIVEEMVTMQLDFIGDYK